MRLINLYFIPVGLLSLALPIHVAQANFLIQPVPVQFVECVKCSSKPHTRPHHVRKYHRSYPCAKDFVTFNGEPAPYNRGRWVNTDAYDIYDMDLATGDDDPMTYPGMNIDR